MLIFYFSFVNFYLRIIIFDKVIEDFSNPNVITSFLTYHYIKSDYIIEFAVTMNKNDYQVYWTDLYHIPNIPVIARIYTLLNLLSLRNHFPMYFL